MEKIISELRFQRYYMRVMQKENIFIFEYFENDKIVGRKKLTDRLEIQKIFAETVEQKLSIHNINTRRPAFVRRGEYNGRIKNVRLLDPAKPVEHTLFDYYRHKTVDEEPKQRKLGYEEVGGRMKRRIIP